MNRRNFLTGLTAVAVAAPVVARALVAGDGVALQNVSHPYYSGPPIKQHIVMTDAESWKDGYVQGMEDHSPYGHAAHIRAHNKMAELLRPGLEKIFNYSDVDWEKVYG